MRQRPGDDLEPDTRRSPGVSASGRSASARSMGFAHCALSGHDDMRQYARVVSASPINSASA